MTKEQEIDISQEDLELLKPYADELDAASEGDNADEAGDVDVEANGKDKSGETVLDLNDDDDTDDATDDAAAADDDSEKEEEPAEAKAEGDEAEEDTEEDAEEDAVDWRQQLHDKLVKGLDEKLTKSQLEKRSKAILNRLKRYKSPEDFMAAGFAAQDKIASGEFKQLKPPEDATEEELKQWREEMGVPEEHTEYDVPKVPGYQWTEADKPLIDSFKEYAHKANYTQEHMNAAAEWYAETMQQLMEEQAFEISRIDKEDSQATQDIIRSEYGLDHYRPTIALLDRVLKDEDLFPDGSGKHLLTARFTDENGVSRRVINDPGIVKALVELGRSHIGDGALVSTSERQSLTSEKSEIEKVMNEDIDRYYREGLDQRYAEILSMEEKMNRGRANT